MFKNYNEIDLDLFSRATIRENTVHSFIEAGKNGADMIELDVHLTADKIPVIYHDFQAPVRLASRKWNKNGDLNQMNQFDLLGQSNFMLAIRDRTFHELQDIIVS
jgi:glycerophosphoryl diester phosphodiesterase